jgi:hypothetical protein
MLIIVCGLTATDLSPSLQACLHLNWDGVASDVPIRRLGCGTGVSEPVLHSLAFVENSWIFNLPSSQPPAIDNQERAGDPLRHVAGQK